MKDIVVKYSPEFKSDSSGVVSMVSWSTLKVYLELAFSVKENEELIGLKVDERGICAHFKTK